MTFVGAGTGRPDNVTLAAVGALQDADAILYGSDVTDTVVHLGRREAARIVVSHKIGEAIPSTLLNELAPGRRIVWLDSGNPDQCRRWHLRETALSGNSIAIDRVAGLGRCSECEPGCPSWVPHDNRA